MDRPATVPSPPAAVAACTVGSGGGSPAAGDPSSACGGAPHAPVCAVQVGAGRWVGDDGSSPLATPPRSRWPPCGSAPSAVTRRLWVALCQHQYSFDQAQNLISNFYHYYRGIQPVQISNITHDAEQA